MSLGNRIKNLRKNKGITQTDLGKLLNVEKSTISMYENSKSTPPVETLSKIANYFNVTTDYLLGNDKIYPKPPKKNAYKIPVYGEIAAGIPLECIEDIEDFEEIDEETKRRGEIFALKVKGDSMSPVINDKDVVLLRAQSTFENGEICAVHINGDSATLKKIKKDAAGIHLISINPAHPTHFYSNKEIETLPIKVIGKLIELRRKF